MQFDRKKKVQIIILALVICFIFYISGVYSGIYARDLIKKETAQDVQHIQNYVTVLEDNLNTMQLEQRFIDTLDQEERCAFLAMSGASLMKDLHTLWQQLPFRIEAHEKNLTMTESYLALKQQYTIASIRGWIALRNIASTCDTTTAPILYFYTRTCDNCVRQGEELDRVQEMMRADGREVVVFTIDADVNNTVVQHIREYYRIQAVPSLVLPHDTIRGRVADAEELKVLLEG